MPRDRRIDRTIVEDLLCLDQFCHGQVSRAVSNLVSGQHRGAGRTGLACLGGSCCGGDDGIVHRPAHCSSCCLSIGAGRINEHLDLVSIIDQVSPLIRIHRDHSPRMGGLDDGGIPVARGALHSSCGSDLVEERLLARDALLRYAAPKNGATLLRQELDVGRKLLGKRGGDLSTHVALLSH